MTAHMDHAEMYLDYARWMVASGQFRGTVRAYVTCLRPGPLRDEVLKQLDAADGAAREPQEDRSDGHHDDRDPHGP